MKTRVFIALALFFSPSPSHANFWEICGDILRVSSAYARVPTDLIMKFWNQATVPSQVSAHKFDKSLMEQATKSYSDLLKSGEKNIPFYGVPETDAGFLNALIDTPFEVNNVLLGSAKKKKEFYSVLKKVTDGKAHTVDELKHFTSTLYEAVYSDAIITKNLMNEGVADTSKFLFFKVWEERMATRNLVRNFKDLGLITEGTRLRKFKDFMNDPLTKTIVDVGLNYGLITHSPVIYMKAPNQKFTSWIKFSQSVEDKVLLGDYEGAWNELSPLLKTKIKADVFYQSARYGLNSVMPYLTAASIGYVVYDRWLDWKKENPDRDTDVPPINVWPKPKPQQLRGVLNSVPNLSEGDRRSFQKTFGI